MLQAMRLLYKDGGGGLGGILRFYRGYAPALLQGPLSRFGAIRSLYSSFDVSHHNECYHRSFDMPFERICRLQREAL